MNPVEPNTANLAPTWKRVVYAEHQPQYLPLPALVDVVEGPDPRREYHDHVVSVWEPDDAELAYLLNVIELHKQGRAPKPRISLMCHVFGQPLQPIRLVVGEFTEPYERGCVDGGQPAPAPA